MKISKETAATCEVLALRPHLFDAPASFANTVRNIIIKTFLASSSVEKLRLLCHEIKQDEFTHRSIREIPGPAAKKLVRIIDRHWVLPADNDFSLLREHLIELAFGKVEPLPDLKKFATKISKAKNITTANEILDGIKHDDIVTIIQILSESQRKTTCRNFDKHYTEIEALSDDKISTHLISLIEGRATPTSKTKPLTATAKKTRNKKSAQPSPMESTAMAAKWDGVDRD